MTYVMRTEIRHIRPFASILLVDAEKSQRLQEALGANGVIGEVLEPRHSHLRNGGLL
jgi:hypothetical protein